eukprot:6141438-Amphidinium_carterae.1
MSDYDWRCSCSWKEALGHPFRSRKRQQDEMIPLTLVGFGSVVAPAAPGTSGAKDIVCHNCGNKGRNKAAACTGQLLDLKWIDTDEGGGDASTRKIRSRLVCPACSTVPTETSLLVCRVLAAASARRAVAARSTTGAITMRGGHSLSEGAINMAKDNGFVIGRER